MTVGMKTSKTSDQTTSCIESSPRRVFGNSESLVYAGSIVDALRDSARRYPDAPVCWFNRRVTTLSQLDERSNRIAQALVHEGIREGDRVAYIAENSDRYFELLFGCAKSGAVLVPIDGNLCIEMVKEIIDTCESRIVFSDDTTSNLVEKICRQCRSVFRMVAIDNLAHAHWPNLTQWYSLCSAKIPMVRISRERAVLQLFATNGGQHLETNIYNHAHFLDDLSPRCFAFTRALPLPAPEKTSTLIVTPASELSASYLGIQGIVSGSLAVIVDEKCAPRELARVLSQFKVTSVSLPSENITALPPLCVEERKEETIL